jgi:hypothetical protein
VRDEFVVETQRSSGACFFTDIRFYVQISEYPKNVVIPERGPMQKKPLAVANLRALGLSCCEKSPEIGTHCKLFEVICLVHNKVQQLKLCHVSPTDKL